MAQAQRFTGEDLVVLVTPTGGSELDLSGDYTAFSYDEKFDTVDSTAGNEESRSMLPTKRGMSWSLTAHDGDHDTWDAFRAVRDGIMTVYPRGNASDLPYFSFPYVLDGITQPTGMDKESDITVTGSRSGQMIADFGSTTGGNRKLVFTTQPAGVASTVKMANFAVSVESFASAIVTADQSTLITLTMQTGVGVISGQTTARVINGVATFYGVIITGAGASQSIHAVSDKGYTAVTSTTFTVS